MMTLATTVATAREIQTQDVILLIVYLVILLVGAYYLTKFVSRRAMRKGTKKPLSGNRMRWKQGQMVSVVDRIPIDRDKTIMVVEFAGKHYLMSTTGQDIKLLDTVEIQKAQQEDGEEEQESAQVPMQDADPAENQSFFKKFWSSFRVVSSNYYKNKNTTPFGIHLRKELDSREGDTHPDNGETGSS